tara:strand:- start:3115 stop:3684 length:570 start_codon:yes stop_codon:yes gene_type:complete
MFILLFFISLVFAQEIMVYAAPMHVYAGGTRVVNVMSDNIPFISASKHVKLAKVKSLYGWEMVGDSEYILVWNQDTIKYKFTNCDYNIDPLGCSIKNGNYYLKTIVHMTEEEGLISQVLYGKNGQILSSSQISVKKIIVWIKQQELTVFEGGFHKPKEELPLKWEIPYRIFREDFEQLSFRTWSGVKLK